MKEEILRKLDELFLNEPALAAGKASAADVVDVERKLGVVFPDSYRCFVERYGGAVVGSMPVFGVRRSEVMGVDDLVLNATESFRREDWGLSGEWVVISMDHAGNPVCMNRTGEVVSLDHDSVGRVLPGPTTFEGFVRCLLESEEG